MNTNARFTLNTKGEVTMIKKCYVIKERKIKDYLNSLGFPSIEDTNRNGDGVVYIFEKSELFLEALQFFYDLKEKSKVV